MTFLTDFPYVSDWLESMLALRDVAERAVTCGNRPVDEFTLSHRGVAFAIYASLWWGKIAGCC